MSDIFFTTNPSDYAKLEGLYVTERKPPGFIRGVDLSTVGMAGTCVRGPLTPQVITSSGQFNQIYGGRDYSALGGTGTLVGNVWAALLNKPFGTLVVRRVAAAAATVATHTFSDVTPTAIIRVDASSVGAWGLNLFAAIEAATDANSNHFNLRITYLGKDTLYQNLDVSTSSSDNTLAVIGTDVSRTVTVTKLATGRPLNATSVQFSSGGSDGTVAASDYNSGMDDLSVFPGVGVCLVPEAIPSPSTFYSHLVTIAPTVSDRIFLTWSNVHGNSQATEVTTIATDITTASDRIVWCYNSAFTIDPTTSAEIEQAPHIWMASIFSQVDIDIHPGSFQTQAILAGITRLANTALARTDLIALKAAGISTLERLVDGFQFRSAVTTNLNPGYTEITRRRMADFLQLSAANRLRSYVKSKNTPEVRAQMAGELAAFSSQLQAQERVVDDFEIDQASVNTDAQRAQGEEHILWRVKLVSHMLALVFETEISTGTVIAHNS